jgi:sulfite exporter TauE/SafE
MNPWIAAFSLGLAGSLHCVGMCGPLVLALPGGRDKSLPRRLFGRLAYNLGRTVTYAIMGLLAGAFGHVVQHVGLQQFVSILLGVLLLATVFLSSRHAPAWVVQRITVPLQKALAGLLKRDGARGLFEIGLLNGLLPCGLVLAALAGASLQVGPLRGALYMALFGLGTTPLLFALSLGGLSLRSPRLRPVLNNIIPAVTCTVAVLLILRGLNLGIPFISPNLSTPGASCCPH